MKQNVTPSNMTSDGYIDLAIKKHVEDVEKRERQLAIHHSALRRNSQKYHKTGFVEYIGNILKGIK